MMMKLIVVGWILICPTVLLMKHIRHLLTKCIRQLWLHTSRPRQNRQGYTELQAALAEPVPPGWTCGKAVVSMHHERRISLYAFSHQKPCGATDKKEKDDDYKKKEINNMMTVSVADFTDFKNEVVRNIMDFLPKGYEDSEIKLNDVVKNNDRKFCGLTIKRKDVNMAPTIYLDDFYKDYEDGKSMDKVLEEIADMRERFDVKEDYDVSYMSDFDSCRDKILPRLVSGEMNTELLGERPHRFVDDLAVIYAIEINDEMSIPVSNRILDMWKITEEELNRQAISNIHEKNLSTFMSIGDFLKKIMNADDVDDMFPMDNAFYVLSNKQQKYGASALLDPKMMQAIIDKVGDFYILPSSVHEVLIIPTDMTRDKTNLEFMVKEVNCTTVEPIDKLSDHVYQYSAEEGLHKA
jgi:hypothetical protein